jgi:hypothetical protein
MWHHHIFTAILLSTEWLHSRIWLTDQDLEDLGSGLWNLHRSRRYNYYTPSFLRLLKFQFAKIVFLDAHVINELWSDTSRSESKPCRAHYVLCMVPLRSSPLLRIVTSVNPRTLRPNYIHCANCRKIWICSSIVISAASLPKEMLFIKSAWIGCRISPLPGMEFFLFLPCVGLPWFPMMKSIILHSNPNVQAARRCSTYA